jgi:hypothetical protein
MTHQIEAAGAFIHACSACAGDYEDPEWAAARNETAEEAEDDDSGRNAQPLGARQEFPVREE